MTTQTWHAPENQPKAPKMNLALARKLTWRAVNKQGAHPKTNRVHAKQAWHSPENRHGTRQTNLVFTRQPIWHTPNQLGVHQKTDMTCIEAAQNDEPTKVSKMFETTQTKYSLRTIRRRTTNKCENHSKIMRRTLDSQRRNSDNLTAKTLGAPQAKRSTMNTLKGDYKT